MRISEIIRMKRDIIHPEQLDHELKNGEKIKIQKVNVDDRERKVIKEKKSSTEEYFLALSKELNKLGKQYSMKTESIHLLFMELSCDIYKLRDYLKGSEKIKKWSMLEDMAV